MSAKRLVVRNLRPFQSPSSEEIEEKWLHLEREIASILAMPFYKGSLEELYRTADQVYNYVTFPLLNKLELVIKNHLNNKVYQLLVSSHVLEPIHQLWQEFYQQIITIKNIFLCIEREAKNFKYNKVQSTCLVLFTDIILLQSDIKERLVKEFLAQVELERLGISINYKLMRSVVEMLNKVQVYEKIIEQQFLNAAREFYKNESEKLIKSMEIPQYLAYVENRILEELDRVKIYLPNNKTEIELLDIVHCELIENHLREILDRGFDDLTSKLMFSELKLIYKLLQRVPDGPKTLMAYFTQFIHKQGKILTDPKNDKVMIQDLLDFKDKLEKIINVCFDAHNIFYDCIRMTFKKLMDTCNNKIAQLLAKFLDSKLRSKEVSDDELELILGKAIKLFKHIQGKDIFGAFYKKHLAKRLLLGKSTNQDAENSMITKLKEECGDGFTSNIEGMFQDINMSKSINLSFKQRINSLVGDFSVYVLTSSYWPNYPNYEVNLPMELLNYQQSFQKFYLGNHSGRKLLWQIALGHCLIRAKFSKGLKELQVSLLQAVVLLAFNHTDKLSFTEIRDAIGLESKELKRVLLSLSGGKFKILLKETKNVTIEEKGDSINVTEKLADQIEDDSDQIYMINDQFTDKMFRVRINQVQLQESAEEELETERHVLVDRQFQIDAAIVRVLKDKKAIKHNNLIKELYGILDIPVSQTDLKKRIELLIEREYMERDKNNKSKYIYVA